MFSYMWILAIKTIESKLQIVLTTEVTYRKQDLNETDSFSQERIDMYEWMRDQKRRIKQRGRGEEDGKGNMGRDS